MADFLSFRWPACFSFFFALFLCSTVLAESYVASADKWGDLPSGPSAWSNIVYQDDQKRSEPSKKHTKHAKMTTLRPAIHWDTQIHSLELLKGHENQTLFFAPEQDAQANSIVPMAWMHYTYKYPVVVLDHTAHVTSIQCHNGKAMTVTFKSKKASLLTKYYARRNVVLTGHSFGNHHLGCEGIDKGSDRYYARVEAVHIIAGSAKHTVEFKIEMMSMHDVAAGLTIVHGHHTVSGPPSSTSATSSSSSTQRISWTQKTSSHKPTFAKTTSSTHTTVKPASRGSKSNASSMSMASSKPTSNGSASSQSGTSDKSLTPTGIFSSSSYSGSISNKSDTPGSTTPSSSGGSNTLSSTTASVSSPSSNTIISTSSSSWFTTTSTISSTTAASGTTSSTSSSVSTTGTTSSSTSASGTTSSTSSDPTSTSATSTTSTSTTVSIVPGPTVATFDTDFDTNLDKLIGYFSEPNEAFYEQVFPGVDASGVENGTKRALAKRHWWTAIAKVVAKVVVATAKAVIKADVAILKVAIKVALAPASLVAKVLLAVEPHKTFHPFTNVPWKFSLPPHWLVPNYNSPFGEGFKIFQYRSKETGLSGTKISAPAKLLQTQIDGKITLNSRTFVATVFCVSCAFTGTPLTTGTVVVTYPIPDITSATLRLHGPMQMHLEVGLDLTYEIGTSADGTGSISSGNMKKIKSEHKKKNPKKGKDEKQLADIPLDPYEIPGIVTLGATLLLKMGASITVAATGHISVGTDSYWHQYDYTIDLINPSHSVSANTKMDINKPFVNVGVALEATAQAYLGLCVMIGLDFFSGKIGIEGGVCDQAGVLAQVVLNLEWDEQTTDSKRSIEGRGFPLGIDAKESDLEKRKTSEQIDVDLADCQGMGYAVYAYNYVYAEAKIGPLVQDFSIKQTSWFLAESCITLWSTASIDDCSIDGNCVSTTASASTSLGATATGFTATTTTTAGPGAVPAGPTATADLEPSSPTQAATIGDYVLVGCYSNPFGFGMLFGGIFGDFTEENYDGSMTPQSCRRTCISRGKAYFGLSAGYICECGNEIDLWYSDATLTSLSSCNTPCAGDANYLSGGYNNVLVYGRQQVVNSPGCPALDGTTYTALNGQAFDIVCGQDNLGNDIAQTEAHSFAGCLEACASYNVEGGSPACIGIAWVPGIDTIQNSNGWPCFLKNANHGYNVNSLVDAATLRSSLPKRDVNSSGSDDADATDDTTNDDTTGADDTTGTGNTTGDDNTSGDDTTDDTDTENDFSLSVLGGGDLSLPPDDDPDISTTSYAPFTSIDFAADPTAYPYYQYNDYPVVDEIVFEDATADDLNVTADAIANLAYAGTTDDSSYNATAASASFDQAFAAIDTALQYAAAANASFDAPEPVSSSVDIAGFAALFSLDSSVQITAASDGNLYVVAADATNTDTDFQFAVDDTGVTGLTYAGGLLHMYSDTMKAIGVSRIRASTTEFNVPLTAQAISLIPLANNDPSTNATYPSVLLAETTTGTDMFFIVACVYIDTTLPVKLFLVNDVDAGPVLLESEVLQTTITGGVVDTCALLALSNGAAPAV